MVCVWRQEVNGGAYETPLKKPAHHLHEKATSGGLAKEYSGIQGFRTLDFSKNEEQAYWFMRTERMNSLLKIVISNFAVCTIHPGVWVLSALFGYFVNFRRESDWLTTKRAK